MTEPFLRPPAGPHTTMRTLLFHLSKQKVVNEATTLTWEEVVEEVLTPPSWSEFMKVQTAGGADPGVVGWKQV